MYINSGRNSTLRDISDMNQVHVYYQFLFELCILQNSFCLYS